MHSRNSWRHSVAGCRLAVEQRSEETRPCRNDGARVGSVASHVRTRRARWTPDAVTGVRASIARAEDRIRMRAQAASLLHERDEVCRRRRKRTSRRSTMPGTAGSCLRRDAVFARTVEPDHLDIEGRLVLAPVAARPPGPSQQAPARAPSAPRRESRIRRSAASPNCAPEPVRSVFPPAVEKPDRRPPWRTHSEYRGARAIGGQVGKEPAPTPAVAPAHVRTRRVSSASSRLKRSGSSRCGSDRCRRTRTLRRSGRWQGRARPWPAARRCRPDPA